MHIAHSHRRLDQFNALSRRKIWISRLNFGQYVGWDISSARIPTASAALTTLGTVFKLWTREQLSRRAVNNAAVLWSVGSMPRISANSVIATPYRDMGRRDFPSGSLCPNIGQRPPPQLERVCNLDLPKVYSRERQTGRTPWRSFAIVREIGIERVDPSLEPLGVFMKVVAAKGITKTL